MAQTETQAGRNVRPKGQPSRNTCWLTAYEMVFNGAGYSALNQYDIEGMLESGGYSRLGTTKSLGLLDSDMPETAAALGLATMHNSNLNTIGGVSRALQQHGVLWVALQIPVDMNYPDGERYKHIVVVVGVDEAHNAIGIVNPWKENYWDNPCKTYPPFSWFKKSIKYTQHLEAGCQFINYG